MFFVLLLAAAFWGILVATRWISRAPTQQVRALLGSTSGILLLFGGIALLAAGRFLWVLLIGVTLILVLVPFLRQAKRPAGDIRQTEAAQILGIVPPFTRAEVEEAYKRMIKKNHPDAGGSAYLAQQITAARKALLESLKK